MDTRHRSCCIFVQSATRWTRPSFFEPRVSGAERQWWWKSWLIAGEISGEIAGRYELIWIDSNSWFQLKYYQLFDRISWLIVNHISCLSVPQQRMRRTHYGIPSPIAVKNKKTERQSTGGISPSIQFIMDISPISMVIVSDRQKWRKSEPVGWPFPMVFSTPQVAM